MVGIIASPCLPYGTISSLYPANHKLALVATNTVGIGTHSNDNDDSDDNNDSDSSMSVVRLDKDDVPEHQKQRW